MTSIDQKEVSYEWNTSLSSVDVYWSDVLYDVSIETIKTWLKYPIKFNQQLRNLSRRLYDSNGIYTNVINKLVSLPTLDRVVFSKNKSHIKFKKNKEKFIEALDKMKDKQVARDILFKLALDGTSFYYFESSESSFNRIFLSDLDIQNLTEINREFNCSAIPLPTDYCAIVGRKNSSYIVAFDLSYFDQFTGNGRSLRLKRYPKEIRDKYREYNRDRNKRWAVLDNNKTITAKVRSGIEEKWGRPFGLASFVDILYDEYFTDTKRGVLDDVNSQIIYQTFPEGEKKGTSSLSQTQQKEQHENIKRALFSKSNRKGLNFFSVAAGTKLDRIDVDLDILKTDLEDKLITRIATNLGFASSALNGSDGNYSITQINIELIAAEIFTWLEQIQSEFNKVINANIIKDNDCYIELYYLPITFANRDKMVKYMKELYTNGKGSLQAWIASTGFNPDAYIALMDYELEEDFDNKYPVHPTSYTLSNRNAGRPTEDNPTNENTIKSKTNNSNLNPRL